MTFAAPPANAGWGVAQWLLLGCGVLFAGLFVVGLLRDRRRFRNGVYLSISIAAFAFLLLAIGLRRNWAIIDFVFPAGAGLGALVGLVLGGFLIVNGVQMLRREGRRLGNLLSLILGVAIIAYIVVGAVVVPRGDLPTVIAAPFLVATLILGYLGFLFVSYFAYSLIYRRIGYKEGVDYVVALGSGLLGSRVPPLLASRLDRAKAAFDKERLTNPDVKVVTSGGQGPGEDLPEAEAMADYLRTNGVPDDAILIENRSRTTEENMEFTKELLVERMPEFRAVVVTNDFHVFRAATYARRAKLNAQVIGARTARYYIPSATIREFIAILSASLWVHLIVCGMLIWLAASRF